MENLSIKLLLPTVMTVAATFSAAPASAHTHADLVAVPAGSEATVNFKPAHGCGDSPTVEVAVEVPVAGAVGHEVEGWTVSSSTGEDGRTVVEWTGGVLPADEAGEFPILFTAPAEPGSLLLFPAIQVCENGEELAWTSGDPAGDHPAPRLLVLPEHYQPAESIDDIPGDAPGRDQLAEITDTDTEGGPVEPAPGTGPEEGAATHPETDPSTTTVPPPATGGDAGGPPTSSDDSDGGANAALVAGAVAVAAVGGAAIVLRRRRS